MDLKEREDKKQTSASACCYDKEGRSQEREGVSKGFLVLVSREFGPFYSIDLLVFEWNLWIYSSIHRNLEQFRARLFENPLT